MIYIERISKDGLSKVRFGFDNLQYVEHQWFYRDSLEEPWGDQWPLPLSYESWCEEHDLEPCYCECGHCSLPQQYNKYRDDMNPVCHRTKSGQSKMRGQWCLDIKVLPSCPDDVAAEALAAHIKSLMVKWKEL